MNISNFKTMDVNMLFSIINMKLRDEFSSLEDFLKTYNIKKERFIKRHD